MFRMLWRKLRFLQKLASTNGEQQGSGERKITATLKENLAAIQGAYGDSVDLIVRRITIGSQRNLELALLNIDGLVDLDRVSESILTPLLVYSEKISTKELTPSKILNTLLDFIPNEDPKILHTIESAIQSIADGTSVLFVQGIAQAIEFSTRGWEKRAVDEPETESVIRGPREGFIETLRVNTALLRRRIRDPKLRIEHFQVGKRTLTPVEIAYLAGVVNTKLVTEVKRRLEKIDTDAILDSGYIEQYIEDAPLSIFTTVRNSERPDVVASKLLEGCVAILVDGSPIVLTVPMVFWESFTSPDDYYSRPYYQTLVRWARFIAYAFNILLPAIYVALTTFHQELLPTPLLLTAAAAREGTPFPAVVEALGMGLIFEILREAGIRLHRPIGQAISIVGALVIGDSAVSAGLIGAPMVIVVALTAISSFVNPAQNDSSSFLRLLLTIIAAILGAYGIVMGLLALLIHLCAVRSFGVPYLAPLAPLIPRDVAKDTIFRAPWWLMWTRPRSTGWVDRERQAFRLLPEPPSEDQKAGEVSG